MGRNRAQEKKRQPYWADEAYVGAQSFRHCGNLNSKIPGRSLLFFFSKNPLDLEACFLELPSRQNLMRSSFGLQLSGAAPSGTFLSFRAKVLFFLCTAQAVTQHAGLLRLHTTGFLDGSHCTTSLGWARCDFLRAAL